MKRSFFSRYIGDVVPDAKSRWIINKLRKLGFRPTDGAPTTNEKWPFWLPHDPQYGVFDSCDLFVTIANGEHLFEVSFRLRGSSDVHVTRYLQLGKRDGLDRLNEFINLYIRIGRENLRNVDAMDVL